GLAGQHLWGDSPDWGTASKAAFPLAAGGVSVWLVRALCRVRTRARLLSHASAVLGGLVIGIGVLLATQRGSVPWLMAAGLLTSAGTVLVIALWTWRRGDAMGGWVLAAHAPLIGVTLLVLLRMFGVAPFEFDSSVLLSASIAAILPLLLAALHLRSKEVLAVQVRARAMRSIDPLTGLLSARSFTERVRAAVRRYFRSRYNAVVLYVRVANYPRIREMHGSAVAEQSMTRAAIKLQRLMPDADCIGRVSESTMGLIFETITTREPLTERASRVVAHGLMPLPGLKPEVTLNLQVVGNILAENPMEATAMQAALDNALNTMSARTRRPIRFLEPDSGETAPAQMDAEIEDDGDGAPLPA
ncbi:MAG: hypothetical protein JWQ07_4156, partial [Ramlibacter sp.]|nr:hypothetical protein [Ramlibacter sp.]